MIVPTPDYGAAQPHNSGGVSLTASGPGVAVRIVPLDELVGPELKISLLKVDVEGDVTGELIPLPRQELRRETEAAVRAERVGHFAWAGRQEPPFAILAAAIEIQRVEKPGNASADRAMRIGGDRFSQGQIGSVIGQPAP